MTKTQASKNKASRKAKQQTTSKPHVSSTRSRTRGRDKPVSPSSTETDPVDDLSVRTDQGVDQDLRNPECQLPGSAERPRTRRAKVRQPPSPSDVDSDSVPDDDFIGCDADKHESPNVRSSVRQPDPTGVRSIPETPEPDEPDLSNGEDDIIHDSDKERPDSVRKRRREQDHVEPRKNLKKRL